MRLNRLFPVTGLLLIGTALAAPAGQAASLPARAGEPALAAQIILTGEREAAAVAGVIVGGAVGALLGSSLNARPAPPPPVIVEEPEERVVIHKRSVRRIVEEEDDAPPPVVEDCVTRRTQIYDPDSDEMIVRKERRCR